MPRTGTVELILRVLVRTRGVDYAWRVVEDVARGRVHIPASKRQADAVREMMRRLEVR